MSLVKKRVPRWTIIIISLLSLLFSCSFIDYLYHRERIYAGVFVAQQDLGGKTTEEAGQLLAEIIDVGEQSVEFIYDELAQTKKFNELGIALDLDSTINVALRTGRQNLHIFRYPERIRLASKSLQLVPQFKIDQTSFETSLQEIFTAIQLEPVDARLKLSADRKSVNIEPDEPGRMLDVLAAYRALETALQSTYIDLQLNLPIEPVEAEITSASLEALQVTEPVASFSTAISGNANRLHNIRQAAAAIDQTLIPPGAVFSFNEIVGQTTAATGYRAAPIIMNGKIVDGIGGGICQVSSTLYNAVLLSDLQLVERRNHGLRVKYLPPGLDATVAYGSIDLKFKNTRAHALWLRIFLDGNKLTTTIYGTQIPGQEVKVYTTDVQVIPAGEKIIKTAELPKGKRELVTVGQPGYRATVWRSVYLNGQEEKTEKISQDSYKAMPNEYRVGTKELPVSGEPSEQSETENE
ncbi:MAG TPA: VanW family protein [Oscillospiraceae bacterium]|nr:VanW family protein [Oscillospiraceae bacterium]